MGPGQGAGPRRFAGPAPGATSVRAQILDLAGETLGHYSLPVTHPPIYVQDGPLVYALQRSAPDPVRPETLAVYREVAGFYPLHRAVRLAGGQ